VFGEAGGSSMNVLVECDLGCLMTAAFGGSSVDVLNVINQLYTYLTMASVPILLDQWRRPCLQTNYSIALYSNDLFTISL
jgi:hypothetical protein